MTLGENIRFIYRSNLDGIKTYRELAAWLLAYRAYRIGCPDKAQGWCEKKADDDYELFLDAVDDLIAEKNDD